MENLFGQDPYNSRTQVIGTAKVILAHSVAAEIDCRETQGSAKGQPYQRITF
jgi:hypothetical protein